MVAHCEPALLDVPRNLVQPARKLAHPVAAELPRRRGYMAVHAGFVKDGARCRSRLAVDLYGALDADLVMELENNAMLVGVGKG